MNPTINAILQRLDNADLAFILIGLPLLIIFAACVIARGWPWHSSVEYTETVTEPSFGIRISSPSAVALVDSMAARSGCDRKELIRRALAVYNACLRAREQDGKLEINGEKIDDSLA